MEKILVSACFLGQKVRYNATSLDVGVKAGKEAEVILQRWFREGRLVPLCPEMAGGLPVPRAPAEIVVREGASVVITDEGVDVTAEFSAGASHAARVCKEHNIQMAVMTENSPSCGSSAVYDGSFSGIRIPGEGVAVARLRSAGVRVFSQNELEKAQRFLEMLENA